MRNGIYSKLAWTNITKNRKIYFPYIVSAIGMVLMFYITLSLGMDDKVRQLAAGDATQIILRLGSIVIGIFSIILLFYTNSFLMKHRKTELGLYNVLGMGKTHIAKVLFWENLSTLLISILLGILGGILFGKAAEVAFTRLMGGEYNYNFTVSTAAILITAALFTGIFVLVYIKSAIEVGRLNTVELLYSKSQGEKEPKGNLVLAFLGLILLGSGYYIALKVDSPQTAIVLFFLAVILVILGTYCTFIAGSVALLKLLKKNKTYYYKTNHFISTSSMIFRMKKHGAGLASICILSTMVLVMISSTACLYFGLEDSINKGYPRDVELTASLYQSDLKTFHAVSKDLDQRVKLMDDEEKNIKLQNIVSYDLYGFFGQINNDKLEFYNTYTSGAKSFCIMTADSYNLNSGEEIQLKPSQLLYQSNEKGLTCDTLEIGDKRYKVIGRAEKLIMRGSDATDITENIYLIVADENEMNRIYQILTENGMKENVHMMCYRGFDLADSAGSHLEGDALQSATNTIISIYNDEDTATTASQGLQSTKLASADNDENDESSGQKSLKALGTYGGNEPHYASLNLGSRTKIQASQEFVNLYGGLFFLGILLSMAFLGATVMIMYYKQVTEGYDDKKRFHILSQVGMSDREIRKSIRYQVLTVFFIPLVGAGIHIAAAFHIIRLMIRVLGVFNVPLLIGTTLTSFLLFAAFYVIVYLITSKAYYKIVAVEK